MTFLEVTAEIEVPSEAFVCCDGFVSVTETAITHEQLEAIEKEKDKAHPRNRYLRTPNVSSRTVEVALR